MSRLRLVLAGLFSACAGLSTGLRGDDIKFDVPMSADANVDIQLFFIGASASNSFIPIRVKIANRSAAERSWRLEFGVDRYGYGYRGAESSGINSAQTFTVPASSTREFFFAATAGAGIGGTISGSITGPEAKAGWFSIPYSAGRYGQTFVAMEGALKERVTEGLQKAFEERQSRGPGHVPRYAYSPLENMVVTANPSDWPADWRVWTPFDLMAFTEASWNEFDEPRRRALNDWVAIGNRLYLVSDSRRPGREAVSYGAGSVVTISRDQFFAEMTGMLLSPESRTARAKWPGQHFLNLNAREWTITNNGRWLTAFMLVFGVVIGPINLFFLAPVGRRHRLFVTVPFISLAAASVLGVVIVLSDGFGGTGTRRSVIHLLADTNQAVVFQSQISRTGLLSNQRFRLPEDVYIEPEAVEGLEFTSLNALRREGDQASGDWFVSRGTQAQTLSRLIPTRERVERVGTDATGAPIIQSSIAVPLRHFAFVDQAQVYWTAAEVPPGSRVALQRSGSALPRELSDLQPTALVAGSFYAICEQSSPDLIPTLPAIQWRNDRVLYIGSIVSTTLDGLQPTKP